MPITVTGTVRGAGDLLTAGAVPFVSSAGTLGQDGSNLFWDNTNKRLGIGTASPPYLITAQANANSYTAAVIMAKNLSNGGTATAEMRVENDLSRSGRLFKTSSAYSTYKTLAANDLGFYNDTAAGNISILNDYASGAILLTAGAKSASQIYIASTGSVGIGPSNTAPTGTASILDRTATTGATSVLIGTDGTNTSATTTKETVRAGASQGSTNLTEWQSNAGAVLSAIAPGGGLILSNASAPTLANSQFTVHAASNTSLVFTMKGSDGVSRTAALTLA